jgi:hypothetical protein
VRRHIFISYQHQDQMKAKGLNLMTYNDDLNVDFVGRHLLDPVNSIDPEYIGRKIREQIKGSSATVVLIGEQTAGSQWVPKEIQWSLDKEPPNGILGIRIDPGAEVPPELTEAGAEIINWYTPEDVHEFNAAIERAVAATNLSRNMPVNSVSTCAR